MEKSSYQKNTIAIPLTIFPETIAIVNRIIYGTSTIHVYEAFFIFPETIAIVNRIIYGTSTIHVYEEILRYGIC